NLSPPTWLVDVTEISSVTSPGRRTGARDEGRGLMAENNDSIHINDDAARGAVSNTGLRYVLAFSLGFAVIAMSLVWIIPALAH
ncbi:MAG: hypothetical protein ACK4MR_07595, partial [Erythrobacter cryptus]